MIVAMPYEQGLRFLIPFFFFFLLLSLFLYGNCKRKKTKQGISHYQQSIACWEYIQISRFVKCEKLIENITHIRQLQDTRNYMIWQFAYIHEFVMILLF